MLSGGPLKIYIAGPYTGENEAEVEWNVRKATETGVILFLKGHFPFVPHLTHYIAKAAEGRHPPLTWDDYMARDLAWLKEADALFLIAHSPGADLELEEAKRMGLRIFYNFDKVPLVSRGKKEKREIKVITTLTLNGDRDKPL